MGVFEASCPKELEPSVWTSQSEELLLSAADVCAVAGGEGFGLRHPDTSLASIGD